MPRMARKCEGSKTVNPDVNELLARVTPDEAKVMLGRLLAKHPYLRAEIDPAARERLETLSAEEIAADVFDRLMSVDLEALTERAGAHSRGYVAPSDAAMELLEEELEDLVEDMKQNAESGKTVIAGVVCNGIVGGLYLARGERSDGALGWAPDFPGEYASFVVSELLRSARPPLNHTAVERLIQSLRSRAPEWKELFGRIAAEFRT